MIALSLRRLALAAALVACPALPVRAQGPGTQMGVDYLILLDVSGSMIGRPEGSGNPIIFPQVKEALAAFLRSLEPGARVTVWPFADGLRSPGVFSITSRPDNEAAVAFVEALEADGSATWVYRSIGESFERYSAQRSADSSRVAALMVFTDGIDNGPERQTMAEVVEEFGLKRSRNDILYYATLGVELPQEDVQAMAGVPYARLVESPKGVVPTMVWVHPRLSTLDFGNLRGVGRASRAEPFDVLGNPEGNSPLRLRVRARFDALEAQGAIVRTVQDEIVPGRDSRIEVEVLNQESIRGDDFEGVLELEAVDPSVVVTPATIGIRFSWVPPRTVSLVSPCPEAACELGTLDPWRGSSEAVVLLRLDADPVTRRLGGNFVVEVVPDRAPDSGEMGSIAVNGEVAPSHVVDAAGDSLEVRIRLDPDAAVEGQYGAWLRFAGGSAQIQGLDSLRVTFTVPRPPLGLTGWFSLIALILLGLAAIGLGLRYLAIGGLTAPKLRGRLDVVAPSEVFGTQVRLSGLKALEIGQGTSHLSDASAILRLSARRVNGRVKVRLEVVSGVVEVTGKGEAVGVRVAGSHELQPEDRVEIGRYVLEYQGA